MRLVAGACPSLTDEVMAKLEGQGVKRVADLMLRDCEELAREASVSYRVGFTCWITSCSLEINAKPALLRWVYLGPRLY